MSDLEKRRSDVAFWQRKYGREGTEYAIKGLRKAMDKLREAEIHEHNALLKAQSNNH